MDHFCTFNQEHHFEKRFPQWINSMTLVMNQLLDSQLIEHEVEEDQTNEPEETIMVLWDWAPTLGLNREEPTEEIQVSSVNVTTRSKGPVVDGSLVLPKIKKMKENMKKILSTTQTTPKSNPVNIKEIKSVFNKLVNTMLNKKEGTKKGLVEDDIGYDIVEDIKKTKENISLFELCNFP